jgi:tetratricopeptide (TPR) repeat protein
LIERAIAVDDGDALTQHYIATASFLLGKLEKAKQHFELSLTLNPHNPNSTINLGLTLSLSGAHREGLDLIDQAFRIDPLLPPAMQCVPVVVHCVLGDWGLAKSYLDQIQNPFACMHLLMAGCLAFNGRHDDAKEQMALFDAKRPSWYDTAGFARYFANLPSLPEDKARVAEGFRKLGIDV